MAKDPNYNRYAGMTSLPGDPLNPRKPRPYRVDEDGIQIFQDESPDYVNLAGEDEARRRGRAGIVDWDEIDRGIQGRLSGLSAPDAKPLISPHVLPDVKKGQRQKLALSQRTINGRDYDVLEAATFDSSLSNGVTSVPHADMISVWNADKRQVAVKEGPAESGGYTIGMPMAFHGDASDPSAEHDLPMTNPRPVMYYSLPILNPKTGSTGRADTFSFGPRDKWPIGTAGLNHGHIDAESEGMVDDYSPSGNPATYGDVLSLLGPNPVPTTTVSNGNVGWHQIENGKLQFIFPSGIMSRTHKKMIQKNLDRQQTLFHKKK
jgi:hypothetical protein